MAMETYYLIRLRNGTLLTCDIATFRAKFPQAGTTFQSRLKQFQEIYPDAVDWSMEDSGGASRGIGLKLSQEILDDLLRAYAKPRAIAEMVHETRDTQTYVLSDDTLVKISKWTGRLRSGVTVQNRRP